MKKLSLVSYNTLKLTYNVLPLNQNCNLRLLQDCCYFWISNIVRYTTAYACAGYVETEGVNHEKFVGMISGFSGSLSNEYRYIKV